MRFLRASLVVVALTLACSSSVSEPSPSIGAHVSGPEAGTFCDAFAVIRDKCLRCHGDPPAHGAPFTLDGYEATQVPSSDNESIRADRMRKVIESGFMPLTSIRLEPPVQALTCEEKATLLAWIDDGARPPPDSDPDCEASEPALRVCEDE